VVAVDGGGRECLLMMVWNWNWNACDSIMLTHQTLPNPVKPMSRVQVGQGL
jgi:hypothetical protein